MKDDYDFSKGVRGKFFNSSGIFQCPIYLDASIQDYLSQKAQMKGLDLSALVNDLLQRDIERLRSAA